MIGMGAFCVCCGAKNASGTETGDQLHVRFPMGCHFCSRARGPEGEGDVTRAILKDAIQEAGYAFVDMEGKPLKRTKKG